MLKYPVTNEDHIRGKIDGKYTIIEYGDFQCPHCRLAFYNIKKLQNELGDELCYVFRHFPMRKAHEFALINAQAIEAAKAQGKFWEMHDLLFEEQERADGEGVFKLAEELGLDMAKFKQDIKSETVIKKIEEDFESGVRSGVNGTPSFFVDGERYRKVFNYHNFMKFVVNK